jgi:hypothetical protein
MAFAGAIAGVTIMFLRELKPFVLRQNGNGVDQTEIMRREIAVTVSTAFANNVAPAIMTQNVMLNRVDESLKAINIQNTNMLRMVEQSNELNQRLIQVIERLARRN